MTRSLRIARLFVLALIANSAAASESTSNSDWTTLFNGKDLNGWQVVLTDTQAIDLGEVFQVHDGVIHAYKDATNGNAVKIGFIATDVDYSCFHLKLEYCWGQKRFEPRTTVKRDAGVLFHASRQEKVWPRCIECQIQEGDTGDCFTVFGAGVQTTVDPAKLKQGTRLFLSESDGGVTAFCGGPHIARVAKGADQEIDGWNTVEVIVRGHEEAIYKVNGHEVNAMKIARKS